LQQGIAVSGAAMHHDGKRLVQAAAQDTFYLQPVSTGKVYK
jgi:hypothetical protein